MLHPDINGGSLEGVLAVHSLSKRSNMAGYRGAFVAGDAAVVSELLAVRKHLGFMVPAPVQAAMIAALADDAHVDAAARHLRAPGARCSARRWSRPASRSSTPRARSTSGPPAASRAATPIDWLAERGILAAPGDFYGPRGHQHVRVAFTATDERIAAAVARL